jgi:hypothetical protein
MDIIDADGHIVCKTNRRLKAIGLLPFQNVIYDTAR